MTWIDRFKNNLLEALYRDQPRDELGRFAEVGGAGIDPEDAMETEQMTVDSAREALEEINNEWSSEDLRTNFAETACEMALESLTFDEEDPDVGGTLLRDEGELVGVAATTYSIDMNGEPSLYVEWLATKRRGYGKKMIESLCSQAASEDMGISLTSTTGAEGFYDRLGMTRISERREYMFSAEEAREIASRGLVINKEVVMTNADKDFEKELADLEPDDGVFTEPSTGPRPGAEDDSE